ncbi:MAG: hypothetical protein U0232_10245 [Thermomicrobiales bacterium]
MTRHTAAAPHHRLQRDTPPEPIRYQPVRSARRCTPGRLAALLLAGLTLFLVACGDGTPATTSANLGTPPTAPAQATATAEPTTIVVAAPSATPEPSATPAPAPSETPATPDPSPIAALPSPSSVPDSQRTANGTPEVAATPVAPTATQTAVVQPTATKPAPQPTATQAQPDPAYYTEYFRSRGWTVIGSPLAAQVTGNGAAATLYVTYGQNCGSCHMQQITVFVGRTVIFEQNNYAEPLLTALPDRSGFVIEEHFPGTTESWTNSTGWRRHTLQWQGSSFKETDRKEYIPPAATATARPTATATAKPTATATAKASPCCKLTVSVLLPNGTPATGLSINAVAETADLQGKFTGATPCPNLGCTNLPSTFDFQLPLNWQGRVTISVPGYKVASYDLTLPTGKALTVTLVPAQ